MRELLVQALLEVIPRLNWVVDLQNIVVALAPAAWPQIPTGTVSPNAIANAVADLAIQGDWARALVERIAPLAPANPLISALHKLLASVQPTSPDPFEEVLLDGDRPFVNRRELRGSLKTLCDSGGSPVLIVAGGPQTGKSYTFYLAMHAGRRCGYIASCYEVGKYVQPDQLAAKLLEEIGATVELRPKGVESAERWAEKLAAQVKTAIEERKLQRLFVFDDFGSVPLPPETLSFIVRLAKYADEELRPLLRVVLIQFPGQLPPALDDVAEHDQPQPFTGLDMLSGLVQVASARGWQVSEAALQTEIQQLETQPVKLRDRFLFLRQMIRKLAKGAP